MLVKVVANVQTGLDNMFTGMIHSTHKAADILSAVLIYIKHCYKLDWGVAKR